MHHLLRILHHSGRKALKITLAMSTGLLLSCQVTFLSDGGLGREAPIQKALFIPSATDKTSQGGFAWRVTESVRRELARFPDIIVANEAEGSIGVDLRVSEIAWTVQTVAECDADAEKPTTRIGADAFPCSEIAFSAQQADVASETESLGAALDVHVVDLKTGQSLLRKKLKSSSGAFPVVGSATLNSNLASQPEFHGLRYSENRDLARQKIADIWGREVASLLLKIARGQ